MDSLFNSWDSNSADDAEVKEYLGSKDAMLILIDVRTNMFKKQEGCELVPFSIAMNAAARYMKRKIIGGGSNYVGVIFYGSNQTQNRNSFSNIYEFLPIDLPYAEAVMKLEHLAQHPEEFQQTYGSMNETDQAPLEYAFLVCKLAFADVKLRVEDTQRIWVFSNDPDPVKGDAQLATKVIAHGSDLINASQVIQLWPLTTKDKFDMSKLYSKIIADERLDVVWAKSMSELSDLIEQVNKKEHSKRRLSSLMLRFGDVKIAVGLYAMILEAKKPNPVKIDSNKYETVKIETIFLCDDTCNYLTPDQTLTYIKYGPNGKIFMTKDEVKKCKAIFPVGIQLLGFKPQSSIKVSENVRSPYFLYPEEEIVKGSTKAFLALLAAADEVSKVAIVRLTQRAGVPPRLAALWPQPETVDEDGDVVSPAGFHVIVLPYANDIRHPEKAAPPVPVSPKQDQVNAAVALLSKLNVQSGYDPQEYSNPVLQKYYAYLEALVYQKDDVEWTEEDDELTPDPALDDVCKEELTAFVESYGGNDGPIVKRKPASSRASPGVKKPKLDPTTMDWAAAAKDGSVSKLTVAVLKAHLQDIGGSTTGKKSDLVQRIADHYA